MKTNVPISETLLISDMDGTLLSSDQSISENNKKAIIKWVEKGGHFTIATGRTIFSANRRIGDLPLTCPAVVFNGGIVYDYSSKESISETYLAPSYEDIVKYIIATYPEIGVEIILKHEIAVPVMNEVVDEHLKREKIKHYLCDLKSLPKDSLKILLGIKNGGTISKVREDINKKLPEDMYSVQTDERYCELLPTQVNKGEGLKKLKMVLPPKIKHVVAFGDFYNDLEMLKKADYGFAMGNAPDDVKKVADFVARDNNDDAIYNGLKMLIEKGFLVH